MGASQIAIYKSAGGGSYNSTTLTDVPFATQIRQDTGYSRVDDVGISLASAGHYLVIYNLDLVSSGGTRGTLELQVILDGVSLAPNGTVSGYFRNSSSATISSPAGSCIVYAGAADQTLKIQARRTDSDTAMSVAEQASPVSSIQIVKLSDTSQYLRAHTSGSLVLSTHNVFANVPIDTALEIGASSFSLAAGSITLKNNRKFLISYSVSYYNASTSARSSALSRMTLDGSEVSGSVSEGYMRGLDGNNYASGCAGPIIIETGDTDSILILQGSVQCTPTTQAVSAISGHIDILELPDNAKVSVATTAVPTAMSTAGVLIPLDAEDTDTDGWHDNATNNTRITVPSDGEYLTFGAFHTDRSASTDTTRIITEVEVKVNGVSTGLSQASEYVRGDEGPNDCLHSGASIGAIHDLTAGQYLELYVRNTVGTTVGTWQTPGTALGVLSLASIAARVVDASLLMAQGNILDGAVSKVIDTSLPITNENTTAFSGLLGNPIDASMHMTQVSSVALTPLRVVNVSTAISQINDVTARLSGIVAATIDLSQVNELDGVAQGGSPIPPIHDLGIDIAQDPLLGIEPLPDDGYSNNEWDIYYNTSGGSTACGGSRGLNASALNTNALNTCPTSDLGVSTIQGELTQTYVVGDKQFEIDQANGRALDAPLSIWELVQEYDYNLIELSMHQAYTYGFEAGATLVEFALHQNYELDTFYVPTVFEFEICQEYNIVGMAWVLELLGYVNEHRADFGLIPIEGVWEPKGTDIAQGHSRNMARLNTFAHDSVNFPEGWETLSDRLLLPDDAGLITKGADNLIYEEASPALIAMGETWQGAYGSTYGPITPKTAFLLWRSSPPHNAIMLWNWQDYEHPVMGFGLATAGGFDPVYNNISSYLTQLFLAYGIPSGAVMHTFELTQTHALDAAGITYLSQEYQFDALYKARKQHETSYSIKVSRQHEEPLSYRVARQHEVPIHYSVVRAHETLYTATEAVSAQHESSYDVQEYNFVTRQHDSSFNISLARSHETLYGSLAVVSRQHETTYDDSTVVRKQHETTYDSMSIVSKQHETDFTMLHHVVRQHETLYASSAPARAQHVSFWDINTYNRVTRSHVTYWTLRQDNVINIQNQAVLTVDGIEVPILECTLSSSESDHLWVGKVILESMDHYSRFSEGKQFTIELQGEVYLLQYNTKDIRRSGPAKIDVSIEGLSPAMALQAPRASGVDRTYDADTLASDMIEDILGEAVTWAMPDWVIPAYRVAAQGAIPLDFAAGIVEAAGGLLDSNIDGSLLVRSKYITNIPDYPALGAVDQVYSDEQDNLSAVDSYDLRSGYNKFRITDDDGVFQDRIEYVADEDSDTSGVLRVYPSPWRTTLMVRTTDASGMVFVGNEVWLTREETETVEFVAGVGSLPYPAESIDSFKWHSEILEGIMHTAYSSELTAGTTVNQGYGLVDITYTVRYLEYDTTAILGSNVQYVVEDI